MNYNLHKPWETLDPWQEKMLATKGDITVVSGRQCGKTAGVSILISEEAVNIPNSYIIIGAYVIEQAQHVFWKVKDYMNTKHIKKIKGTPTLNFMELKNGSKIFCKAIGDTGAGMRGPTATLLVLDETAFIPDRAWIAIEPVIALARGAGVGRTILLSTPQSKRGFFYKSTLDPDITQFKVSARDCPRHTKAYLDKKQAQLSPIAFAQEYLSEFLDDYNRKFSSEWIKKVFVIEKEDVAISETAKYVMGVDVGGGVGKGETTFEVFDATDKKNVKQVLNLYSTTCAGPDIERQILALKLKYNFGRRTVGFDSRGIGSGSFAYMMENSKLKNRVVALDYATRPTDNEGKTTKLLKEYMFDLVEEMGWRGELKLLNDGAAKQSFESIQVEHKPNGDRSYHGAYDHIADGVAYGVWMAKTKGLNIMAFCK